MKRMGQILSTFHDNLNRIFLTPESLRKKRRIEQLKTLTTSSQQQHDDPITKSTLIPLMEQKQLIQDILSSKKTIMPSIVKIGKEQDDPDKEIYLYLSFPTTSNNKNDDNDDNDDGNSIIRKVPLTQFTELLSIEFEQQLTSTALCFISDASSGLGTQILSSIVTTCQDKSYGMALIPEPNWMMDLALLMEDEMNCMVMTKCKLEKVVFGLCRYEAWSVRDHLLIKNNKNKNVDDDGGRKNLRSGGGFKTVVFTLPGQSCTSQLLPLVHKVFPCERHVFVYDGCVDSTHRALNLMTSSMMLRDVTASIPITQLVSSSINTKKYAETLSSIPYTIASIVECWMTSVNTFLSLKSNERSNGYVPFVCRLGYLTRQIGRLGNGDIDVGDLALMNVMQYITGSRSRSLDEDVFKVMRCSLNDCIQEMNGTATGKVVIAEEMRVAIEACVFCHKGILIGDKTLLDTVQPKEDWSLKAAKKLTACACCAPGEGEEDDEDSDADSVFGVGGGGTAAADEGGDSKGNDGADDKESTVTEKDIVKSPIRNTGWTDGKSGFAFDPSKFTGM